MHLFVVANAPRSVSDTPSANTRNVRDPLGGDRLYRNDGGHFVDVSAAAGIYGSEIGLGLGVAEVPPVAVGQRLGAHTSELQPQSKLPFRLPLGKKKNSVIKITSG